MRQDTFLPKHSRGHGLLHEECRAVGYRLLGVGRRAQHFQNGIKRAAQEKGYDIVVITNQSGIERGYFTEADYERLTAHMRAAFAAEGVTLLDVLHCPYLNHPDRKPAPGLFLKAQAKWGIDMAASYSLGDKPRDVQAGCAAGVGHNYLLDAAATVCADAAGIVPTPAALIPFLN